MNNISPWVLKITLLLSISISAAALFLTRTYAVGNLAMLGLDAETVFVRRLSIDVLLSAHVAAFFLVALLPDSVFRFRRWQLYALALAIWAFDGAAIYQARFGVMDSADQVQVSAVTRLADQRAAIESLQASAAALRTTASRQLANTMITAGSASQAEAARLSAKAAAMSEQLAAMPSGAGTTEVRTWGAMAPYKAAAESALISLTSLIMLGLAGLTLRELLQQAAARRPAQAVASMPAAKPTPAPAVSLAKAEPMHSPKVSYGAMLAGAGIAGLGAAAAPPAHSAPAAPVAPAAPADVVRVSVQRVAPAIAPVAPAQVQAALAPTPKAQGVQGAQAVAPAAPVTTPAQVQKRSAQVRKKVPAGLRDAIMAKEVQPAQKAIRVFTGCNQDVAIYWLEVLGKEGVIEPKASGRGWKLKATA